MAIVDEVYVADYVHHDPPLPAEWQRGRDNYKQGIATFFTAFPDLRGTIEHLIAEGDTVAHHLTWRGTHRGELMGIPPTGKQVEFSFMGIYRIVDGKIVEGWVTFDAMGMMQQLGVVPPAGS